MLLVKENRFVVPSIWEPFQSLEKMGPDFDRLFSSFWLEGDPDMLESTGCSPTVNLYEEKDRYVLRVDVPGVRKEDLSISLSGDTLILKGERKDETEIHKKNDFGHAGGYGAFQRTVHIPGPVKSESVTADYADGVLKVFLPKVETPGARTIKIQSK